VEVLASAVPQLVANLGPGNDEDVRRSAQATLAAFIVHEVVQSVAGLAPQVLSLPRNLEWAMVRRFIQTWKVIEISPFYQGLSLGAKASLRWELLQSSRAFSVEGLTDRGLFLSAHLGLRTILLFEWQKVRFGLWNDIIVIGLYYANFQRLSQRDR
jgi:hypothetical protein